MRIGRSDFGNIAPADVGDLTVQPIVKRMTARKIAAC
jgi:hypothetical protein